MLTSGKFWIGFVGGAVTLYAFNIYAARRVSQ